MLHTNADHNNMHPFWGKIKTKKIVIGYVTTLPRPHVLVAAVASLGRSKPHALPLVRS